MFLANNFTSFFYKILFLLLLLCVLGYSFGAISEEIDKNNPEQNKEEIKQENVKDDSSKTLAIFSEKIPLSKQLWGKIGQQDLEILRKIAKDLNNENFEDALEKARKLNKNSFLQKNVEDFIHFNWYKSDSSNLRKVSFNEIVEFVENNDLPSLDLIRRNAENVAIKDDVNYQAYEKYLEKNRLLSLDGKLHNLKAKQNFANSLPINDAKKIILNDEVKRGARDLWVANVFSKSQEKDFLEIYQNYLTKNDYINRIEYLLWNDKFDEAKRVLDFVDDDYKKLFEAIIEINNADRYIDKILLSVPRSLRDHDLLTYERVVWHHKKKETDEVVDLLLKTKAPKKFADQWWRYRKYYGRELIKSKDYSDAYKIFANNGLPTSSVDFWEGQWTSGWIALRFLDKPQNAYIHFSNLHKNVRQPVSVARAAYWLGMASYEMGNKKQAIDWYKTAAKYPLFFYGQLAIHKHKNLDATNARADVILPEVPKITNEDMAKLKVTKALKMAYIATLIDDRKNAFDLFKYAVNKAKSDGEVTGIVKVAREAKDAELTFRVSREAGKRNVFFIKEDFIVKQAVVNDKYAPLVHAIIKQESGFVQSATSSVGALGFMQIMPDTAKVLAKNLKVKYSRQKLITDMDYNIKLGSYYIKQLIDEFEGSEIMAIASYNAGPNATRRWATEFFDPGKEEDLDKVVDWIELITYSETRNYVQRVMENLIVYKYLMYRNNYDEVK